MQVVRQAGLYVLLLLVSVASLLSAGCGDDSAPAETDTAGPVVELSHNFFDPSELTVDAGATVTFRNLVAMSHPLLSEAAGLDTGQFPEGERTFTFSRSGTYTVTNTAHNVDLTVVVR